MYVTTFYSFKGGVGRTQALVNVAFELARKGRRVLLVDFDLEAPGLDTFEFPERIKNGKGVLDFVYDYIETGVAPPAANYIQQIMTTEDERGSISVMPAGERSD